MAGDINSLNLLVFFFFQQLLPKTVELNLSHNRIKTIQHLQWLSHMTYLDLSHNAIETIEALHSKLGNLKTLNLSGNKLQTLKGKFLNLLSVSGLSSKT